jgi:hypothetical protein
MSTCHSTLYAKIHILLKCAEISGEPGSAVSIVSCYSLDDPAIDVRSSAEAKDFSSSPCVQTGSGAYSASCPVGTGGPFPGSKAWPRRDADHSPPSSAEVENEWDLYFLSPQALHGV